MDKHLKGWLIFGIIFISVLGSLSHFLYEWSGENTIMGLLVATNESTWEHIKLAIFPSLIVLAMQYQSLKSNNFWIGSFLSIITMILFIPVFFYGYKLIFGGDSLILDILDFILAVIVGQLIFYKVMKQKEAKDSYKYASIFGLIIIIICYLTFTYYPPHNFLFEDPISHKYGIEAHNSK